MLAAKSAPGVFYSINACREREPDANGVIVQIVHMAVEWDPRKAKLNARQHGVDFADVVGVLKMSES
jgi:hypothetical protein